MKLVLIAAALAVACPDSLRGQETTPRTPEISASGRGESFITPDHAILVVTVETNSSSASGAAEENAKLVTLSMEKLRTAGAKTLELTNGGYSLNQDYENGDRRRPRGFVARNSIRIEVPRVADVGKLIDAAVSGGANLVSPIQYLGPNMDQARRDALKSAANDATRDAQTLAAAAGGTLGRLISMSTGIGAPPIAYGSEMVRQTSVTGSTAVPTSIRPTDLVVSAIATGRWEFVPKR